MSTVSLVKLNVLQNDVNVGLTTTFTTYLGFRFYFHGVISAVKFIKKNNIFQKVCVLFLFLIVHYLEFDLTSMLFPLNTRYIHVRSV